MKTILKTLLLFVALTAFTGCNESSNDKSPYEILKERADNGLASPDDLSTLGFLSSNGWGAPKDDQEAVKWYRLSAEQGDTRAQDSLGFIYSTGRGVPQNATEAMKWYRLAAEQGNASAQGSLGSMYRSGEGIQQNDQEAVKWYRLSAEQGNESAQNSLGFMFDTGRGVARNKSIAYIWYSVAAAQGLERASSERDRIGAELTPQALQQAQAQATRCFESNFQDCDWTLF